MALGRTPSNSDTRDYQADFQQALLAEYRSYLSAGYTERAKEVADQLKLFGLRPEPGVKERAVPDEQLERAVEGDAPPKRPGRPKKAQ